MAKSNIEKNVSAESNAEWNKNKFYKMKEIPFQIRSRKPNKNKASYSEQSSVGIELTQKMAIGIVCKSPIIKKIRQFRVAVAIQGFGVKNE